MGFFLFILVNATLFLRPSELFPSLATVNIYEALILSCFACSFMSIVKQFSARQLEANPITLGVLIFWQFCGLCHIMQMNVGMAVDCYYFFFKIVIYYLLFIAVIDTPAKLRVFLLSLGCMISILTLIAVLRYEEVIVITVPVNTAKAEKL